MVAYRALLLGPDDNIKAVRRLECSNDNAAVEEARRLADGYDVELWERGRKVVRLTCAAAKRGGAPLDD